MPKMIRLECDSCDTPFRVPAQTIEAMTIDPLCPVCGEVVHLEEED